MDQFHRLRSWVPRMFLFLVLAILVLVGVIQYQWFTRSAAVEIEGTLRGLEGGLRQSVFREFQRYAPVISELETLEAGPPLSLDQGLVALDHLWSSYGPLGTSPHLLSFVGCSRGSGQGAYRSAVHQEWTWTTVMPPEVAQADQVFRVAVPGNLQISLGIDMGGFSTTYLVPALLEQFPGADVHWGLEGPPPPLERENFNSHTYLFNPFTAFLPSSSVPRTLRVGTPRVTDFPQRAQGRILPPEGLGAPTAGGRPLTGLQVGERKSPGPAWTIEVTLPANAPVLEIERRLAWNWFGGSLLLIVLGAAFALVLVQSDRTTALRRREREFVASVSHELRTPLTVIRSAADNFTKGIVPVQRQGQYGQLILDQALRLGRMIEEMLLFAQAEASSTSPRVQVCLTFGPWLAELRPPLEALAEAQKVTLLWDVAGVPASGQTDPQGLRMILENLVINAINHAYPRPESDSPARLVRVTLRYLVPDRLELAVDDDGRGISPQEAKKVFEPFYRDQISRRQQERGSGLGLFLARHQARRLGGDLKLESPWRRLDGIRRPGCRFVLSIPFQTEEGSHGR